VAGPSHRARWLRAWLGGLRQWARGAAAVVPMQVRFGPWPVGSHNAAAGTGPGDDVGKRVPRQQGLAAVTAVKRQQTIGLDGRWQHVRPTRRALEGVHCKVRAFEPIRLDLWYTRYSSSI
jgi:hypothetical protein